MSSAVARLAALGLKPLSLRLELAAAYVGYGPKEFLRLVTDGKYPAAMNDGGKPARWLVEALDAAARHNAGLTPAAASANLKSLIDRRMDEAQGSLSRKTA